MHRSAPVTFDEAGFRGRLQNDGPLMREVINLFVAGCPVRVAAVREAADRGDAAAFRLAAHTLKGSAGNIGGSALFDATRTAERIGAESRMEAAVAASRQIELEAATLVAALTRAQPRIVATGPA